ncbi:predicted protein [Lichtheimia corymbifera JMRC:FSU:9682]|uniref:Uncharacterized protein n=1 Tax=Lichtheimia corymbifera JMRC:FSU:9682 TaxID=1263082 RepID=A0A068RZS4_9FUNG|nr:predicted protein [Lichtheimia corymbifera JMRC:FSU:9682]
MYPFIVIYVRYHKFSAEPFGCHCPLGSFYISSNVLAVKSNNKPDFNSNAPPWKTKAKKGPLKVQDNKHGHHDNLKRRVDSATQQLYSSVCRIICRRYVLFNYQRRHEDDTNPYQQQP